MTPSASIVPSSCATGFTGSSVGAPLGRGVFSPSSHAHAFRVRYLNRSHIPCFHVVEVDKRNLTGTTTPSRSSWCLLSSCSRSSTSSTSSSSIQLPASSTTRRGPRQRLHVPHHYILDAPSSRSFSTSSSSASSSQQRNDPYKVLGLHRTASAAEIKTKYRELAKQNHPDLNKNDPSCAARMSRITDAYSLLVDPKRRREFDHSAAASGASEEASGTQEQQASGFGDFGGSSGIGVEQEWVDPSQLYSEFSNIFGKMASRAGRGGRGGPAPARGDDASVELKVSFHEAMRGARRRIQLKLQLPCNDCGASGAQAGSGWSKCPMCNGTGVRRVERGIMSMGLPCAKCGGVGDLLEHACETCSGEGVVSRKVEVEVEIPPGIKPGMELRLPGQGHAGARGGRRGHLFVLVNVESHPKFRHIDDDLHADVDVSLRTMLLGGKVKVPTLEGDVDLNLPPLNEPSSTRILRGKGPTRISGGGSNSKASNSGNLILHFGLKLPHSLTEEQKRLIHAFDQIEREKTTANEDTKTDPDTSSARPSAAGTSSFSSTTTSTHSRNDASSCRSENIEQVGEHDQSSSSSFRGSMATRRMASASKNW